MSHGAQSWDAAHSSALPATALIQGILATRMWAPCRNFIDGGMAASIKVPHILQRTLTVYGDVSRLTTPLGIDDRSTIALFIIDHAGTVLWSGTGVFDATVATQIEAVLTSAR